MTTLGDLYYEGKEYEARLEHLRPGVLSAELREALGMEEDTPPPWLINMQARDEERLQGQDGGSRAGCRAGDWAGWGAVGTTVTQTCAAGAPPCNTLIWHACLLAHVLLHAEQHAMHPCSPNISPSTPNTDPPVHTHT